eukprot:scaffold5290_cov63-Phaeocystis_antarctica.AAC.1
MTTGPRPVGLSLAARHAELANDSRPDAAPLASLKGGCSEGNAHGLVRAGEERYGQGLVDAALQQRSGRAPVEVNTKVAASLVQVILVQHQYAAARPLCCQQLGAKPLPCVSQIGLVI